VIASATFTLAFFPALLAVVILLGMIYKGSALVALQLKATQDNTVAIQQLTERLAAVERVNVETNVIASGISDKVSNATADHPPARRIA